MPVRVYRRVAATARSWTAEQRDAFVYAASAVFAVTTIHATHISLYREWGEMATGPYIIGAVASMWAHRREQTRGIRAVATARSQRAIRPADWSGPRMVIFLFVAIGATLLPLSVEVVLQSFDGGTTHIQPEGLVVERTGGDVLHGQNPYMVVDGKHAEKIPLTPGQPAYDKYNPYGPLMSVLGLLSSLAAPTRPIDVRIVFALVTLLLLAGALALCRGRAPPRILTLQGLTVLPIVALPLSTGGDDVPVVAVLLLGMLFLRRRQPLAAGLLFGVAAGLKFTAWPLVVLALLVARDREGRQGRGRLWTAAGMAAILVPTVTPLVIDNPQAFVQNVLWYPLGLAHTSSPAASALPGHDVVTAFPHEQHLVTLGIVLAGAVALAWALWKRRPRTPAAACLLVGWVMTVGIMLAPATRLGYFLYPVNFFIWAWLLRSEDEYEMHVEAAAVVSAAGSPTGTERALSSL